jgi:ABC-type branched-subunit amino acid transport system ATPase component
MDAARAPPRKGIIKRFWRRPGARDVDFTIAHGGIYGLIGRTAPADTLFNVLTGTMPANAGRFLSRRGLAGLKPTKSRPRHVRARFQNIRCSPTSRARNV